MRRLSRDRERRRQNEREKERPCDQARGRPKISKWFVRKHSPESRESRHPSTKVKGVERHCVKGRARWKRTRDSEARLHIELSTQGRGFEEKDNLLSKARKKLSEIRNAKRGVCVRV